MVAGITISLIEVVSALNILITLVMMVMEKYRDIAILMSMGTRREQIRRIFVYQGVLIGAVGAARGKRAADVERHLAQLLRSYDGVAQAKT